MGEANCFLAVTKVLGLVNDDVQDGVIGYRNEIREKLRIDDIKMLNSQHKKLLDENWTDDLKNILITKKFIIAELPIKIQWMNLY